MVVFYTLKLLTLHSWSRSLMGNCPTDEDLSGFLNDSLPVHEVSRVSTHVDGCTHCQVRLDKLTGDEDGAVARYKGLSSSSSLESSRQESSPDAGTLIVGLDPLPRARLVGLPSVPGFDVLEEIGRGGMGVVYKARHRRLNRLVALKMILAGAAADARVVQRFLFEAEILARVQHPQVVQIFEVDTYPDASGVPIPYLAMELLEGGALSRHLRKQSQFKPQDPQPEVKRAQFDPRIAAELMEGIAGAVHSAHSQGIIHRDLKPGNILFAKDDLGGGLLEPNAFSSEVLSASRLNAPRSIFRPKVTDFGLAKFIEDVGSDQTGSGQVLGTPHYMAPEQATGVRQIGPTADVYALGAILYECLSGRRPFEGSDPMSVLLKVVNETPPDVRNLCRDLPPDLAAVVMRCLAKDPRRRYASAAELADDLRRFLENRPTVARPVTIPERFWLWTKRNPAIAGLVLAQGTVLVLAFIAITSFWLKAERTAHEERQAKDRANLAETVANNSRQETIHALEEATRQKNLGDLQRAQLEFARAVNWCEEGRVAEGLESFARTVELSEAVGAHELARVARVNRALWPRELPTVRKLFAETYQPRQTIFFPDGRHGVIASRGANLVKWETTTNQKVLTYRTSYKHARVSPSGFSLAFAFWSTAISPNGKTLVTSSSDGQVWVWDVDKPEALAAIEAAPPDEDVWGVAFAPDGTLWATDGGSGVKRWNLRDKKIVARLMLPDRSDIMLQSLAVSSDGKRLFAGDRGGRLQEWDTEQLKPLRSWKLSGWVGHLALSPGDHHLAATGTDGFVRVIELATGRQIQNISLAGAYGKGVAFSRTQEQLIASDADGIVRGWNWKTGVPIGVPIHLSGEVLNPAFLPNSDEFVVPAGDAVYRCRLAEMNGQMLYWNDGRRIHGLDFSPDGDRLVIASEKELVEFDLARRERLRSLAMPTSTLTVCYDPDRTRKRLFRGTRDGFEILDALDSPELAREPMFRKTNQVVKIEYSRDGRRMYTEDRGTIFRWDPTSFKRPTKQIRAPEMPNGIEIAAMDVRPDGRELLAAYANKVVFLDAVTLEKTRPHLELADDILEAKYLPDGTRLLVGRRDSVAQVVDAGTGVPIGPPMTHSQAVLAAAVSPDSDVFLTGSRDGTARFWDAATGLPLGPPLRHSGAVTHVKFNPNGTLIATGTGNGEVNLTAPPKLK